MRRVLLGLAVTAFTVLALAGPTSADSAQVTHFRMSGTSAGAVWFTSTATSATDVSAFVDKSNQGDLLFAEAFTLNYDANGNFTGATQTFALVTSGFSFTLRQSLASASLSGSALPGTTCTYDATFNLIGCSDTTLDVTAAWTGQGPISRGEFNRHFRSDGFNVIDQFSGTERTATATGTVAGRTVSAGELVFANLGTTKSGTVTVCIGSSPLC